MSIEQAQAFLEKVKNDEDLAKKLSEAQDKETKLEIARMEGYNITAEQIQKAKNMLADEKLDEITGGVFVQVCDWSGWILN